ncbi:MAG: hypothetical protein K2H92_10970, partial [Bacteroidaceae bacterium]|nr:hypothetical protein [Bacteroidaceae bacterium]
MQSYTIFLKGIMLLPEKGTFAGDESKKSGKMFVLLEKSPIFAHINIKSVSSTHLRAHETSVPGVC